MLPIWLLAAMMIMMYYWKFWEPCANAMLVVALVSQRFPQRARALAENNSARFEDFDPKTGKTQPGRSRFPLTRARVGGNDLFDQEFWIE